MIRTTGLRRTFGIAALGLTLAAAGAPFTPAFSPLAAHAHAASISQEGPVLAGTWLNFTPGARFSDLQIGAATTSGIGAALPTSITYGVNVFSLSANRYVAFGVSAPVPFLAAGTAVVPLKSLIAPTNPLTARFAVSTTLTLSLIDRGLTVQPDLRVAIHDHSLLLGDRFSVEVMHR